ncbi:serine hydrolase [Portibacter marinus]|uniref:serine hydrolase n=1 Tax=Portibacter marinus TaxID=2898660 RepID=UPI001F42F4C1|nr:serine hydrolase [Portibacter marinus]
MLLGVFSCEKEHRLGQLSFLDIGEDSILNHVFDQAEKYELQIRYVQIDRAADGSIDLKPYEYRIDEDQYFYPASTVKMPVAFLALEKLNELYQQGYDVNYHTALQIDAPRSPPQTPVVADSSAFDNAASIGHYIHKLFVVSDNDAYNRLFEFVGPQEINQDLRSKGIFTNSRIIHRVGVSGFSPEENRHTNPFRFYRDEELVYEQPAKYMERQDFEPLDNTLKGKGYINSEGILINQPFDFSEKNFVSLRDLQQSLISVMTKDGRFNLREEDYDLLYKSMSMYPGDSEAPIYDTQVEVSGGRSEPYYYDGYVKFFMFGNTKEDIPDHIKIYNKVGFAYGYLTDCAYIVDAKNDVEFFLAATLHVNENGIYNDGIYEYDKIGLPFLDRLGDVFYQYELSRRVSQ